ncbi:MAG: ABC transporter substrate-binding protein, partial [Clostridiales bacterium]|nr:ABC transporter substrate-binding protein [Clostridiales bacterium]
GKMAAQVLKGEKKASELPYETIEEASLYINEKAAEDLGIEIPSELKDSAAESFTEISEK